MNATETEKNNTHTHDTEFSLSAVPAAGQTQGLWAAMSVLVGFTFFAPSMTAGGNLGLGLTLSGFVLCVALGNAFLGLYCGTLAHIGQKTGLSYDLLAHRSFGSLGSYLPSAIITFTKHKGTVLSCRQGTLIHDNLASGRWALYWTFRYKMLFYQFFIFFGNCIYR